MKVIIEAEIAPWWGVEDILSSLPADADKEMAIIELLQEDIPALLDGAEWKVQWDVDSDAKPD